MEQERRVWTDLQFDCVHSGYRGTTMNLVLPRENGQLCPHVSLVNSVVLKRQRLWSNEAAHVVNEEAPGEGVQLQRHTEQSFGECKYIVATDSSF